MGLEEIKKRVTEGSLVILLEGQEYTMATRRVV